MSDKKNVNEISCIRLKPHPDVQLTSVSLPAAVLRAEGMKLKWAARPPVRHVILLTVWHLHPTLPWEPCCYEINLFVPPLKARSVCEKAVTHLTLVQRCLEGRDDPIHTDASCWYKIHFTELKTWVRLVIWVIQINALEYNAENTF